MSFPQGFFWGAATASHQVEGNNHNDWSEWEKKNADRLAHESEAAFHWNPNWQKFRTEATNPANYISGAACDHWNRYREDFDLMQSLGLNAYRFSLEWSRIEPKEGIFNEDALTHYRDMVTALRERNIEPFITLWHWTLPLWVTEKGGVEAENFPEFFTRYTKKVVDTLGHDVRFWITLNEPDVNISQAYLRGQWPPQKSGLYHRWKASRQLQTVHKKSYQCIKNAFPQSMVGIAKHYVWFEASPPTPWNLFLKKIADTYWNNWFLGDIEDSLDFIGLNHYHHHRISGWFNRNENKIQTDFGWEYYPASLYHALVELKSYKKPIYVTENGIADASDTWRKKFIPLAISSVEKALSEKVDVRGYFYWSLLDNFEWDKGYWLKFGLIAINRTTQKRTVRESAKIYSDLLRHYSIEQ